MALVYATVASQAQNGSLVQSLTESQGVQLGYDYMFNYNAFLSQAQALINQKVQAIEANEAEGQRNFLTIDGWAGQAGSAANAINQQWAQGKLIGTDGKPLQAWPDSGYNTQIAWATNGGDTLELRWLKEEWQLYLVIFVLIAIVGYLVYRVLTTGSWNLQTANPQATTAAANPVIQTNSGTIKIFSVPWYWWVAGAGALAVSPWAYRKVVELKEDRAADLQATRHLHQEEE